MEERKMVILAGVVFALVVAVGAVLYFFIFQKPEETAGIAAEQPPALEEEILPKEEEIEPIEVDLDESDDLVRKLVAEISSHPDLARWLLSKNLIRRAVAAVDNIAVGESPRSHIDFFEPKGDFQVNRRAGEYFINPASFKRYDLIAEVFVSLNTKGFVTLYRRLTPAIREAYKELGYPDRDFETTLHKAILELLEVPVVEEETKVALDVISYRMLDQNLENLSPAQKHLLRMGPDNVRAIQAKLQELAHALGYQG